jgi:hypothetical protein
MNEIFLAPMAEYDVTCQTKDCENENILIRVSATAENPYIICGACSQVIENIVEVN